jgi:hypothetical protein
MNNSKNMKDQKSEDKSIDASSFYEKYIDHRSTVIIIAIILLIIGMLSFLQICCVQAGWSDPCGCAASSAEASGTTDDNGNTSVDPSCVALWEFVVICIVLLGAGLLFYYWSLVNSSKKLIAAGNIYGAAEINGKSDKGADLEILGQQTKIFMDAYTKAGGDLFDLDPDLIDSCPLESSDDESEDEQPEQKQPSRSSKNVN